MVFNCNMDIICISTRVSFNFDFIKLTYPFRQHFCIFLDCFSERINFLETISKMMVMSRIIQKSDNYAVQTKIVFFFRGVL